METHVLHGMNVPVSVQQHHSFFWNTKLTAERMREISDWIGTLSKEDRNKLDDLEDDVREDDQYPLPG
jgi:hypothetical protein